VDDDADVRDWLEDQLGEWGYRVASAADGTAAHALAEQELFEVALLDLYLPDTDGLQLVRRIRERDPAVALIIMTGNPTVPTAIEALKLGCYDYLVKPINPDDLRHCLQRAVEHRYLRREVETLRRRLGQPAGGRELIGMSQAMERVRSVVQAVAPSDVPVLIESESGTGKELIAESLHRLSGRRGPLVPVNCGAIPADLVESELFGHVRGAFSGAVADAVGLFRAADGGTIFLDEITELPVALQPKLLRALQEGEVRPVGSSKTMAVDVRIVAATNRRLDEAVRAGMLRQDLYYRLNVVRIAVPPLRDRREDIPLLVTHLLREVGRRLGRPLTGISPEAMAALMAYDFPGNVRELENILERECALGARGTVTLADLPPLGSPRPAAAEPQALPTLAQMERDLIIRALALYGQDKDRAARAIGLSRRTMYRRVRDLGLSGPR
jgi:DNA-binding NtrC family response regulator